MSNIDDKNNSPNQESQELAEVVSVRIPREVREVPVTLKRSSTTTTADLPLWVVIRKATEALSFDNYNHFLDLVFSPNSLGSSNEEKKFEELKEVRFLPYNDSDAYRLLKVATEAFLMVNCGVASADYGTKFSPSDTKIIKDRVGVDITKEELGSVWNEYLADLNGTQNQIVPYLALIRDKLRDSVLIQDAITKALRTSPADNKPNEYIGILRSKLTKPCLLELIWSYWHEEGMLVQTMNALSLRFQNIRGNGLRDPLAMLEIDPLRPLNNLIWSYIQDEQHRLTVVRRAYEYDHHYGITLYGKAVPTLRPADSRSKFIEAFHNLLYLATVFFKEDDDTTVIADGFPLLNALKEVHLVLSESAHNQYGDLPSTSRIEMLMQQWILARPEFREFLPTRIMVAYPERWMDRVDAMKSLQNWTNTSVLHFHNLGVFGEQILLAIRFGAWSTVNDPVQAANWARYWRAEIQGYIHAYRSVTGVDLSTEITTNRQADARYLPPPVLLRQRLALQQNQRLALQQSQYPAFSRRG